MSDEQTTAVPMWLVTLVGRLTIEAEMARQTNAELQQALAAVMPTSNGRCETWREGEALAESARAMAENPQP